jgi:anti-anti-sigma factor
MSITSSESSDGTVVTISVDGRFDSAVHQQFMLAFKDHPRGEKEFVVDLENAEYMDSSALGMLLQLRDHGARSGEVKLVNGNKGIREILHIANFDKLFKVA